MDFLMHSFIVGINMLVREAPWFLPKSCKFAYDSLCSLNMYPNNKFLIINLSNQFANFSANNEKKKLNAWKIGVSIIVPALAVVIVTSVIAIFIIKKRNIRNIVV